MILLTLIIDNRNKSLKMLLLKTNKIEKLNGGKKNHKVLLQAIPICGQSQLSLI
jgi:hypothetical protein